MDANLTTNHANFFQHGLLTVAKHNDDYNNVQMNFNNSNFVQEKLINPSASELNWQRRNELEKDSDTSSILDVLNETNRHETTQNLNHSSQIPIRTSTATSLLLPLASNPPSMATLAIAAAVLKNGHHNLNMTENFASSFFNQAAFMSANASHELGNGLSASPSSSSASSLSNSAMTPLSFLFSTPAAAQSSESKACNSVLFDLKCTTFKLPIPQPQPQELNMQFLCETVSRLLFLSVHWIKNVQCLASR